MKVLLINGSPRQQGNTATALAEVAKQLSLEGIESEIVWIGNKPVRGCIACGQCAVQGLGRCVFDDDICNRISAKFKEADALIVGSPVYYGQPNGALLSIIQRAFYSNGAFHCRMSSWWCHSYLRSPQHAFSDDEYARSDIAILEHRLWPCCR